MLYKRGKTWCYNFRWSLRNPDGSNESFRIRQSAKTGNKQDAKDAEDEHRRALRLGEIHPRDPWPKPSVSAPPIFRSFAKEFLQYAKTHTKPGTHTFYEGCLERLLAFAAIADAPLNAITGDLAGRYARHRQEVAVPKGVGRRFHPTAKGGQLAFPALEGRQFVFVLLLLPANNFLLQEAPGQVSA